MVLDNKFENESRFEYASYCTRDPNSTTCSGNATYNDTTDTVHLDVAFSYTDHTWKRRLHVETTCNNGTGETINNFQWNTCRKYPRVYYK